MITFSLTQTGRAASDCLLVHRFNVPAHRVSARSLPTPSRNSFASTITRYDLPSRVRDSIALVFAFSQLTIIWRLRMWSSSICDPWRTRRNCTIALRVYDSYSARAMLS